MTPEAIRRPRRGPCCAIAPVSALLLAFGALLAGTAHAAAFEGMFPSETLHIAPPPDADDAPAAAAPVTYAAPSYALPDRRELAALSLYRERGIASYYGRPFHGRKTSSGDLFDMYAMTAAHPTLPIPSYVRVTNLANGRSVVVRVNDRGPYHPGRAIDLSYTAAYKLGLINGGSGQVEVEAIIPGEATGTTYAQTTPPARQTAAEKDDLEQLARRMALEERPVQTAAMAGMSGDASIPKGVYLQLGAFSNADNAENLKNHLLRELDWVGEAMRVNSGGGIHRLHLGPYASRSDAEKVAERIRADLGFRPTFVTR